MQTLEGRLLAYNHNRGRILVLQQRIESLQERIAEAENINGGSPFPSGYTGIKLDGMPKARPVWGNSQSKIISPYELQVIELYEGLEKSESELRDLTYECETVGAALEALRDKERFVLIGFYCEGNFWGDIIRMYKARYDIDMSRTALCNIRTSALKKLEKILT